uniref:Uncharacterized protein n=1 Tax=Anas zonorhyncha TaxID=75864 RepID=A0A8B9UD98_9AVES
VTEDHGLGNGDSAIDITESLELLISVIAQNIILLNSVQRLLFSLQLDNVWKHLAVPGEHPSLPLNANALILMALDKHLDFLRVYEFQLGAPVQHSARRADYNLLRDLLTSLHCQDTKGILQLWVKLSHLFDHFSRLKCQLVCWGKGVSGGSCQLNPHLKAAHAASPC